MYAGNVESLGDIIIGVKGWTDTDGFSMIYIDNKWINGGLGNYSNPMMRSPFGNNWVYYKKINSNGIVCDIEWNGITYTDIVFSRMN